MHMLFYEQAVCESGTKIEKGFDEIVGQQNGHCHLASCKLMR